VPKPDDDRQPPADPSPVHPTEAAAPGANGLWPGSDADDAVIVDLLARNQPASPPARPEFASALRGTFLERASGPVVAPAAPPDIGGQGTATFRTWRERLESIFPTPLTPRLVWGVAGCLVLVAALARSVMPAPPAVLTREELVARNARAWAAVRSLTGTFEARGERAEEWVSWQGGRLRYRRFVDPSGAPALWKISDGRDEWTLASSGEFVGRRPAPEDSPEGDGPGERMQCAALALPTAFGGGRSDDVAAAAEVDGRPAYRVAGPLDPALGGGEGVYWIDAADYLVYRIDGADGAVVWRRRHVDVNPALADEVFRPEVAPHTEL